MRDCFGLFEQQSKGRRQAGQAGCASPLCPLKLCHNKPSACFVFVAATTAPPAVAVVASSLVAASSPFVVVVDVVV